jgi:RNA polymerase sigma-70 factor (ECF subfamily)
VDLDAIIRECLEGKEGAWNVLVDLFSKRVFNLAYQFAGSYQEAEDLTQDIFVKLYTALPKYDFGKNFAAWLLTLAKNHLIDAYRRTKWEKKNRDDFEDHAPRIAGTNNPEFGLTEKQSRRVLWEALNRLPAEMRLAVILKEIQEKKYEEVADIMGVPVGTVKSRINRGRLQLARILNDGKESGHEL